MSVGEQGLPVAAVTFDLWQTLMHDTIENGQRRSVARVAALQAALAALGFDRTLDAINAADRATWQHCEAVWSSLHDVPIGDQVSHLLAGLAVPAPPDDDAESWSRVKAAYVDAFFDFPPTPVPALHDVLEEVRGWGLRIGLICNTGRTPGTALRRLFEQWGVLGYFDHLTFSNEVGIRKPAPAIFWRTLKQLGAEPAEAVHVGDDLVSDIAGAKGAGLRAILVRTDLPSPPPTLPDAHVTSLAAVPKTITRLSEIGTNGRSLTVQ